MAEIHGTPVYSHEECITRVVWAAHLLSYRSNNRNHEEVYGAGDNAEHYNNTNELSDCGTDYETEQTVILSGPRDSVRRKFLDSIAQLLSPCKGWGREDGVEVDVARNDGFLSDSEISAYCKMLEEYLTSSAGESSWPGKEPAIEAWTTMADLILKFDVDGGVAKFGHLIAQQVYRCVDFAQVRELVLDAFGTQSGLKLWSMLKLIASRWSTLEVGIFNLWENLKLSFTPESVIQRLGPFIQEFEKACAESFSLHAEMQLVLHYDRGCAPQPTLDYFGCSKKNLLCETFLGGLSSPIATREGRGVFYPA
ncbi:hypothetical protein GX51_05318 [Blastomyces parvus]|uniref:Uncharacterized protein n=1 Tax=Blastomyces parvus TaxID=2060905 RepID=A0A2B7WXG6_9EURO|nr:hypothetical protein GX51_05318 [Blastomyces parvus]